MYQGKNVTTKIIDLIYFNRKAAVKHLVYI